MITKYHYSIFLIFCFILATFAGATSLNPILPQYIMLHNNTTIPNSMLYGILAALFPLGQFLSAYLLPYFARRYGYHYIIQVTSVCSFVATLLISLCLWQQKMIWVFLLRFICGCFEANVVLTREIVLGMTNDKTSQKQWLGIISSGITLGFLVGPSVNGFIYSLNPIISLFFPTIMVSIMVIISYLFPPFQSVSAIESSKNDDMNIQYVSIKRIWLVSLSIYFAADLFYQYIPYYLAAKFNLNVQQIAVDLFLIAFANAMTAPFAYLPTRYMGYRFLFLSCSLLFMVNLACFSLVDHFLIGKVLLFFNGALIALLSNNVIFYFTDTPQKKNNFMMSHIVSARVLVSAASALFAGQIATMNLNLPLYLSIMCIWVFLISLRYQWKS